MKITEVQLCKMAAIGGLIKLLVLEKIDKLDERSQFHDYFSNEIVNQEVLCQFKTIDTADEQKTIEIIFGVNPINGKMIPARVRYTNHRTQETHIYSISLTLVME